MRKCLEIVPDVLAPWLKTAGYAISLSVHEVSGRGHQVRAPDARTPWLDLAVPMRLPGACEGTGLVSWVQKRHVQDVQALRDRQLYARALDTCVPQAKPCKIAKRGCCVHTSYRSKAMGLMSSAV